MRTRDERGGIALLTALTMVLLVGAASFAVDLGMQRVVRSDLQALADVVALDAARLLDGRTAGEIRSGQGGRPTLDSTVSASAGRNTTTLGEVVGVTGTLVSTTVDGDGALVPVRDAAGAVRPVPDSEAPDGVWIQAEGVIDFAFTPGSGGAVRTALAIASPSACFRMGSWAAAVDPANEDDPESSKLNEMLGLELGVSAVGYHGLADSRVELRDLAAELGAGSADEMVALVDVRLRDVFAAAVRVLTASGGDAADVTALQVLATSGSSELDATIDLADLLAVSTGEGAVLSGAMNVLDLVSSAAYVTDGDHFVAMENLWAAPKFSEGDQEMTLVERPRTACGPPDPGTFAQTAQLRLTATPVLHTESLSLSEGDPSVALDVFLAGGSGALAGVDCGDGSAGDPESMDVTVARELSHAELRATIPLAGEVKLSEVGLLDLAELSSLFGVSLLPGAGAKASLDLEVNAGVSVGGTDFSQTRAYAVPPRTYDDAEVVGDGAAMVLPPVTIEAADITGTITFNGRSKDVASSSVASRIDLTGIIAELTSEIVSPAINDFIVNVNEELAPVAALLGLRVGGVDLFGLRRPSCENPRLRG